MSQTVLVADDSQTIRKVVQMALKASAFDVVGVGSGREAMEAAQQQPVVILLDYYMPDASGYDVCRALKNNGATSNIPVIMLGGTYKSFDPDLARDSGAAQVIMKPFSTDQLINAIEDAVNGAGALEAAAPAAAVPSGWGEPAPVAPTPPQPTGWDTPAPSQPAAQPFAQREPVQPEPAWEAPARPEPARAEPARPEPVSPMRSQMSPPAQTPVPESQPRIPVQPQAQSRAPSGSQPRIPSGSEPRIPTQDRRPTPIPSASGPSSTAGAPAGGAGLSVDEIKALIQEEVKATVRAELPGLLRNVMGEVFQKKVLPKLLKHSDDKIQRTISEQLEARITARVRSELERLLDEG